MSYSPCTEPTYYTETCETLILENKKGSSRFHGFKTVEYWSRNGPVDTLSQVARRLKKTQIQDLTLCATLMRRGGQYAHAFETYTKLADFRFVSYDLSLISRLNHVPICISYFKITAWLPVKFGLTCIITIPPSNVTIADSWHLLTELVDGNLQDTYLHHANSITWILLADTLSLKGLRCFLGM